MDNNNMKQNNKWKYQGDSRYEKVYEKMQLLDWDKSQLNEQPIKKKILYKEVKGCKIYGVWYE
jgi:hypothetical protein